MQLVIKEKNKMRLNHFIEWLLYLIGDIIVFIVITSFFKSVYIDTRHSYIYSAIIVLIISILNKTIKPILVYLTLPLTGLTLGLFYPLINVVILKITDLILGQHFNLSNIFVSVIIAILISIMNQLMDNLIIKPLIRRFRHE